MKKIVCFSIFLFFNFRLFAQIIYTDIPDATPNATYSLDLNNDLVVDFLIQFQMANKVICIPQNNNAYAGTFLNGEYLAWALSNSTSICDTLTTWYDAANPGTMAWGTTIGYWVGQTDTYLAMKLIDGTNTYYGWARLDILESSSSFTVKDYAYESTPNACIQAGQVTLGYYENSDDILISVSPNPFTSSTTIHSTVSSENRTVTMLNILGERVKQHTQHTEQPIIFTRDNLKGGCYYIQLFDNEKIIATKKVIIID